MSDGERPKYTNTSEIQGNVERRKLTEKYIFQAIEIAQNTATNSTDVMPAIISLLNRALEANNPAETEPTTIIEPERFISDEEVKLQDAIRKDPTMDNVLKLLVYLKQNDHIEAYDNVLEKYKILFTKS